MLEAKGLCDQEPEGGKSGRGYSRLPTGDAAVSLDSPTMHILETLNCNVSCIFGNRGTVLKVLLSDVSVE